MASQKFDTLLQYAEADPSDHHNPRQSEVRPREAHIDGTSFFHPVQPPSALATACIMTPPYVYKSFPVLPLSGLLIFYLEVS